MYVFTIRNGWVVMNWTQIAVCTCSLRWTDGVLWQIWLVRAAFSHCDPADKIPCFRTVIMAMLLKSLFLAQVTYVASEIAPGDCAFVGIYGEQDDFAVVLLEDAEGDELSISETLPSVKNFEPRKVFKAKRHVMKAQHLFEKREKTQKRNGEL